MDDVNEIGEVNERFHRRQIVQKQNMNMNTKGELKTDPLAKDEFDIVFASQSSGFRNATTVGRSGVSKSRGCLFCFVCFVLLRSVALLMGKALADFSVLLVQCTTLSVFAKYRACC